MEKNTLKKLQLKLLFEKDSIEKQLQGFSVKDSKLKNDWDSKFPNYGKNPESQAMEEAASEVEEYSSRLPIEYKLELRLKDINIAIEKIEKGDYGICEKCKKKISLERLMACSEARMCIKCENQ